MDPQEWQVYVQKVITGAWPIPSNMVSNPNDWRCRSIVGRALYLKEEKEEAMIVLSTVLDVEPNMEDAPEYGLSEAEHKVLCLRDIAEIVWDLTKDKEATLRYLDEAFRLSREYKYSFRAASRGDIWYRILNVYKETGDAELALFDAKEMIESENENSHAPSQDNPDSKINPYKYFSFKFWAEAEYEAGNIAEACSLLMQGFEFYPVSQAGYKDLEKAEAITDPEERYKAYQHCTTIQYLPWEKLPEAVIRRNI